MTVTDEGSGRSTAALDAGPVHHNPHGFVHGAALFAMGAAAMGILEPSQRCSTIELHLRFLRPVISGRLSTETSVIKAGRTILQLESSVTDDDGRTIATATGTFAVIDGRADTPKRAAGSTTEEPR